MAAPYSVKTRGMFVDDLEQVGVTDHFRGY